MYITDFQFQTSGLASAWGLRVHLLDWFRMVFYGGFFLPPPPFGVLLLKLQCTPLNRQSRFLQGIEIYKNLFITAITKARELAMNATNSFAKSLSPI